MIQILIPFFSISIIALWYGLYAPFSMTVCYLGLTVTIFIGISIVLIFGLCVAISITILKDAFTLIFSTSSNYFEVAFIGTFYLIIMQVILVLGIDVYFCINYTLTFFFCYIVLTPSLFVSIVNFLAHPVVLGSLVLRIIAYFQIKCGSPIYCADDATSSSETLPNASQPCMRTILAKSAGKAAEYAVENISLNAVTWSAGSAFAARHILTEMQIRGLPLRIKMVATCSIFASGMAGKCGADYFMRKLGLIESRPSPLDTVSPDDIQRAGILFRDRYASVAKNYPAQSPLEAGDGLSIWTLLTTPFSLSFNSSFFESYFNTVFYISNLLVFASSIFFLFMFLEYLFSRYYKEENTDTANFVKRY